MGSGVDERTERYLRVWTDVANLYFRGLVEQASALADEMGMEFPERLSSIGHTRAFLLALLGRRDEALDAMQGVVDQGGWWNEEDLNDPDLEAVRGSDRFTALAERMRAAARVASTSRRPPKVLSFAPSSAPTVRALLVVLHMHGIPAEPTMPHWLPATGLGVAIAVPESSQAEGDGFPCWDDPAITERDVRSAVIDARSRVGSDVPLILAGGSQGGNVALRLALSPPYADCRGVISVSGGGRGSISDDAVRTGVARGMRAFLIVGGDDLIFRREAKQLHDELNGLGLEVRFEEAPGVPHSYPPDLGDRVERAVHFILER